MDPLFSRGANRAYRAAFVVAALLAIAVPLALMARARSPTVLGMTGPVEQPVPFDHEHHVAVDGIDCRYCHWTADRSRWAGVPPTELCMGCHRQILSNSPFLEPVRRSVEDGTPIAWRRVHRLPDFVFFDHRAHDRAGVGCETCHGRVDRMPRVRQVAPLTMAWCLDCHREAGPRLRPVEKVTTMGYAGPAASEAAADGPEPPVAAAETPDVSPGTDCTTCHR